MSWGHRGAGALVGDGDEWGPRAGTESVGKTKERHADRETDRRTEQGAGRAPLGMGTVFPSRPWHITLSSAGVGFGPECVIASSAVFAPSVALLAFE